jgi:O-antigen ligase
MKISKKSLEGYVIVLSMIIYPFVIVKSVTIFYAAILTGLIFLAISISINKGKKFKFFSIYSMPVLLFFAWMPFTYIYANYPDEVIYRVIRTFPYFFLFMFSYRATIKGDTLWVKSLSKIMPITVGIIFIYIYLKFGSIRGGAEEFGAFSNVGPSIVEAFIPFLLFYITTEKSYGFALFSLILTVGVIIYSGSRGAFLIGVLGIVTSILILKQNSTKKVIMAAKASVLVILIILILLKTTNIENIFLQVSQRFIDSQVITTIFDNNKPSLQRSDYVRSVMYFEGIRTIKENPVLGIGLGGISKTIDDYYGFEVVSHNFIITAWGEMGVIGLFLILLMFVLPIKQMIQIRRQMGQIIDYTYISSTLVGIILLLLNGLFMPQLTNPVLYLMLGLAIGYIDIWKKYTSKNKINDIQR